MKLGVHATGTDTTGWNFDRVIRLCESSINYTQVRTAVETTIYSVLVLKIIRHVDSLYDTQTRLLSGEK